MSAILQMLYGCVSSYTPEAIWIYLRDEIVLQHKALAFLDIYPDTGQIQDRYVSRSSAQRDYTRGASPNGQQAGPLWVPPQTRRVRKGEGGK